MDDIDDLLDEVELKYCSKEEKNVNGTRTKFKIPKHLSDSQQTVVRSKHSELDDLVDEIMKDDGLDKCLKINHSQNSSSTQKEPKLKLRCSELFIGGTQIQFGAANHINKRLCDQLHCLTCDNRVVYFDNFEWDENKCDYLVFRNSYPDFNRLKSVLLFRNGCRAYCCQCSWLTGSDLNELVKCKPSFKWICKRH